MIEELKEKVYLSVNKFNEFSEIWKMKIFDMNIFDVDYHVDKQTKNKLKEVGCQNFIQICFSTDSNEKRATVKEFTSILENEIGFPISHMKNLIGNHFYIYFKYEQNFTYDVKVRRKLISKSIDAKCSEKVT